MKRVTSAVSVALSVGVIVLAPAMASAAEAQELTAGTWTGTMQPPEGGVIDVEFEIEIADELVITLMAEGSVVSASNVELVDGVLHFGLQLGRYVTCELPGNDDGGFEGECTGDGGVAGYVTMSPPKESADTS